MTLEPNHVDLKRQYENLKEKYDKLVSLVNNDADNSTIQDFINDSDPCTNNSLKSRLLSKTDKLYKILINNYPNGSVIVFDKNLRYILADGKGLQEAGLSNEMLENKLMSEIVSPETYNILEPIYKKALEGISSSIDVPFVGNVYSTIVVPVPEDNGAINYGMVLTQDITDKIMYSQKLEKEVEARTDELEKLNKELNRSVSELNSFAYVASHDLQEPLRTIAGFSQVLIRRYKDKLDEAGKEHINTIFNSVKRMQDLINALLSYSKVGKNTSNYLNVDLNNILEIVIENINLLIKKNNVKIEYGDMPVIKAEYTLMIQLFQNLIVNSIKYRNLEPPIIKIDCKKEEDYWLFSVKDNGMGIEEKYFEKIFVVFKRLHNQENYSGTGIGLSTVKKIIELHGGRIWLESKLGEGTTFYFTINT